MFRRIVPVLAILSLVASASDLKYTKKMKDANGEHGVMTFYVQGQRLRVDHRNEVGYGWKDGHPENIYYGPRTATIFQCDMQRVLQLDFDHHQYTATEVDRSGVPVNGSADPPKVRQSGVRVKVIVETRDTGETRPMFGLTAHRFITTRRVMPTAGACTQPMETTEDGWYIDIEQPQQSCTPKPKETFGVMDVLRDQTACVDDYDVERTGPALPPFAVDVTRTVRIPSNPAARPTTAEEIVSDLSRLPLDPQIFDLPTGYKHVDELDQSPSLPYLLRAKLMWQSVKTTVWGWTPWGK